MLGSIALLFIIVVALASLVGYFTIPNR